VAISSSILAAISPDRFATYRATSASDDEAHQKYCWNIALSSAFYGPMQSLEVAMRNAIHRELSRTYGSHWWDTIDLLGRVQRDQVADAIDTLRSRGTNHPAPGQVVAELSFGFWVGLTGRTSNYERTLWQPAVRHAFTNFSGQRSALQGELDHLRVFRNRIAHHEPIFRRHLAADHDSIIRVVDYLDASLGAWIRAHSRVPTVISNTSQIGIFGGVVPW
jgi:Abi-like protein